MPEVMRPDGATLHYEVHGAGFPVLALAPGGPCGGILQWTGHPADPVALLADRFRVIVMDQRYAGSSRAPMFPFSYEQASADQVAVLNTLGVERCHVFGSGFGCQQALRLLYDAPARTVAAVLHHPVGVAAGNTMDDYFAAFNETIRLARAEGLDAVIAAAEADGSFENNPAAGPWARRLHDEPAFREAVGSVGRETYVAMVVDFRDGLLPWDTAYFSINDVGLGRIRAPMLVAPGSDRRHPAEVAERLCRGAHEARLSDDGIGTAGPFLAEHTPSPEQRSA